MKTDATNIVSRFRLVADKEEAYGEKIEVSLEDIAVVMKYREIMANPEKRKAVIDAMDNLSRKMKFMINNMRHGE